MFLDFQSLSHTAGMCEDLVQAGGGNSSVKLSDTEMVIKASGVSLSEVTATSGWSRVDYRRIAGFMAAHLGAGFTDEEAKRLLADATLEGARPSIETFLHAITGRVTLHTHPTLVNALTARRGGMDELRALFPGAVMVGYATPGAALAQTYFRACQEASSGTGSVAFLKNHGLIVSGDTVEAVLRETDRILGLLSDFLQIGDDPYALVEKLHGRLMRLGLASEGDVPYLSADRYIKEAAEKYPAGWPHTFCPDCVVYCGKAMFPVTEEATQESAAQWMKQNGRPVVVLYRNHAFIVAENIRKAREIESVLRFSAQVAMLNEGHEMDLLSEEEQNFLLGWEAEKYRRQMK